MSNRMHFFRMNRLLEQDGLSARDLQTIHDIFSRYPEIQLVHIFGSRAKGNYNTGSDIDLAIMNKLSGHKTMLKIKDDFEESSLPYKVDLVEYGSLTNIDLTDHIKRRGKVFYQRNESNSI